MSASRLGDEPNFAASLQLTKMMLEHPNTGLVLDSDGQIQNHYESKMRAQAYGIYWVQQMATRGKIERCARCDTHKGARVKLQEAGFPLNNEDFKKYVRTAAGSTYRTLITHDSDYNARIIKILRKELGVTILSATDGCGQIEQIDLH